MFLFSLRLSELASKHTPAKHTRRPQFALTVLTSPLELTVSVSTNVTFPLLGSLVSLLGSIAFTPATIEPPLPPQITLQVGDPSYVPFAWIGSFSNPSAFFWMGNLVDSFYLGIVPASPFVTFNGEGGTAVFLVGPPSSITFESWDVTFSNPILASNAYSLTVAWSFNIVNPALNYFYFQACAAGSFTAPLPENHRGPLARELLRNLAHK